jgi:flagellin-like protein
LRNKKGISPLIATVLLIGFTIILAALVMRWGRELFVTQTSEVQCESEGQTVCASGVFIEIAGFVGNEVETNVSLVSSGKQDAKAVVLQVFDEDGNSLNSTRNDNGLAAFSSNTFKLDHSAAGVNASSVEVIPIIDYTTDKGRTCEVPCSLISASKE